MVAFPRARFAFNESPPHQPLWTWGEDEPQVEIRCLALPLDERYWSEGPLAGGVKRFLDRLRLAFWITANHPGPGRGAEAAQTAGTLLKAVLTHPGLRTDLAAAGMSHLRAERPVPVASTTGSVRLVSAIAELHYTVPMPS